MYIKKYCITLIFLLFGLCATYSQERRTEICVDFRVNSTVIDSTYSDNAVRMQESSSSYGISVRTVQSTSLKFPSVVLHHPKAATSLTASWHEVALQLLKISFASRWIFPTVSLPIMTTTFLGSFLNPKLKIQN